MAQVCNELDLEINIGKKDLPNYLLKKNKENKKGRSLLQLDHSLQKLVWIFSATAVAVPVHWVCGVQRFQGLSPAQWLFVLEVTN